MNSINDIKDEKVRRLAETLRQSGLAASETEAIRMAMSMTNTGDKVSQNFDEKKDDSVMGLSHMNKDKPIAELAKEQEAKENTSEPVNQAEPASRPDSVQESAPQEHVAEKKEDCECGPDCNCNKEDCDCSKEKQESTPEPVIEPETDAGMEEEVNQELAGEPQETEEKPDDVQTDFQTPKRAAPKKDISEMEESKIDLSQVFNSAK